MQKVTKKVAEPKRELQPGGGHRKTAAGLKHISATKTDPFQKDDEYFFM